MNIAERFGATIEISGPDPDAEGTFFVKRPDGIDHDAFVTGLLGVIGNSDRLVLHHRAWFAIVQLPFGRAQRLKRYPWIAAVGGVNFDPEQFAAVMGPPP